ncbi:hypothetical protein C1X30_34785, partial [Pseudomonas sp. FW305-BF6]
PGPRQYCSREFGAAGAGKPVHLWRVFAGNIDHPGGGGATAVDSAVNIGNLLLLVFKKFDTFDNL